MRRGGGEASQNFIYDFLDNKAAKIKKKTTSANTRSEDFILKPCQIILLLDNQGLQPMWHRAFKIPIRETNQVFKNCN
jgi:hypothetical protein